MMIILRPGHIARARRTISNLAPNAATSLSLFSPYLSSASDQVVRARPQTISNIKTTLQTSFDIDDRWLLRCFLFFGRRIIVEWRQGSRPWRRNLGQRSFQGRIPPNVNVQSCCFPQTTVDIGYVTVLGELGFVLGCKFHDTVSSANIEDTFSTTVSGIFGSSGVSLSIAAIRFASAILAVSTNFRFCRSLPRPRQALDPLRRTDDRPRGIGTEDPHI